MCGLPIGLINSFDSPATTLPAPKPKKMKAPPKPPTGPAPEAPQHLPESIPDSSPIDPEPWKQQRFGLKTIKPKKKADALLNRLAKGFVAFKKWATSPIVMSRVTVGQLSAIAYDRTCRNIHQYLGFIYRFHNVSHPTFMHYLNAHLFVAFLAFCIHVRGIDKAALLAHIYAAYRVVSWLIATNRIPSSEANVGCQQWLLTLYKQAKKNLVPICKDDRSTKRASKSLPPHILTRILVGIVEDADIKTLLYSLWLYGGMHGPPPTPKVELAIIMHNALFAAMFWGYIPPLRPSIVMSLMVPTTSQRACPHPSCQRPELCKGNRLEWINNKKGIRFIIPHHKNTKRWAGKAIVFDLPTELFFVFKFYLEWGQACLTCLATDPHPFVFCNPATGRPLKDTLMSKLWGDIVLSHSECKEFFGPQNCRAIFATTVRNGGFGSTPDPSAAAAIMGHSLNMWDKVYDRDYDCFSANQAVKAMDAFREEMLCTLY